MRARPEDADDDRKARERLCAATRQVRPVAELIRFVVSPDDVLTPDLRRVLPGRGVWVSACREAFDLALRKKAFARSLRRPVTVPTDLGDLVETLLHRAAIDMLSMCNKAGLVTAGFAKAMERIEKGTAAVVIQAAEGADHGVRKIEAAMKRRYSPAAMPKYVTMIRSADLDLALGRSNVIHAALASGPATSGFLERLAALEFWRDGTPSRSDGPMAREGPQQAEDDSTSQDGGPATDNVIETLTEHRGDPQDLVRND